MIRIKLKTESLGVLISGLYIAYNHLSVYAVPAELFLYIAEELSKHLNTWDYDECSIEDWVWSELLIIPKDLISDEEYENLKDNELFIEYNNGGVVLIATGKI